MFPRTVTELFNFVCSRLMNLDLWTKHANKREVFGHKIDFIEQNKHLLQDWDSWECILMKSKGKWIFIMLFLTSVDSNMADISLACLSLYSDYCMVCFFGKAFLKSDTAVALRRTLSKVPSITLVFSSTFIMSISVNWCGSAKSPHVLELLNITRQCKIRFLDINMHFIEQNIHVLYSMKFYECHLKIIKG